MGGQGVHFCGAALACSGATETPAPPAAQLVDTPETLQEVLVSCLIFYTVRLLVNRLADALPAPPRSLLRAAPPAPAAAATSAAAPLPPALGPLAAGVAAVAAVGAEAGAAAAGAQSVKPTRSEEQEAEGVKYEGYAEAIAAAQVGRQQRSRASPSSSKGQRLGACIRGLTCCIKMCLPNQPS